MRPEDAETLHVLAVALMRDAARKAGIDLATWSPDNDTTPSAAPDDEAA